MHYFLVNHRPAQWIIRSVKPLLTLSCRKSSSHFVALSVTIFYAGSFVGLSVLSIGRSFSVGWNGSFVTLEWKGGFVLSFVLLLGRSLLCLPFFLMGRSFLSSVVRSVGRSAFGWSFCLLVKRSFWDQQCANYGWHDILESWYTHASNNMETFLLFLQARLRGSLLL